jgi:hypothetical protein
MDDLWVSGDCQHRHFAIYYLIEVEIVISNAWY